MAMVHGNGSDVLSRAKPSNRLVPLTRHIYLALPRIRGEPEKLSRAELSRRTSARTGYGSSAGYQERFNCLSSSSGRKTLGYIVFSPRLLRRLICQCSGAVHTTIAKGTTEDNSECLSRSGSLCK